MQHNDFSMLPVGFVIFTQNKLPASPLNLTLRAAGGGRAVYSTSETWNMKHESISLGAAKQKKHDSSENWFKHVKRLTLRRPPSRDVKQALRGGQESPAELGSLKDGECLGGSLAQPLPSPPCSLTAGKSDSLITALLHSPLHHHSSPSPSPPQPCPSLPPSLPSFPATPSLRHPHSSTVPLSCSLRDALPDSQVSLSALITCNTMVGTRLDVERSQIVKQWEIPAVCPLWR